MEMIVVSAEQTSGLIAEISTASAEQASAVEEINRAISQLEGVTQQNAALVEQASAVALSSAEEARRLATVVTRFRTDSMGSRSNDSRLDGLQHRQRAVVHR
jgi:methyl-accepting chemotaxis protein